MELAFISEAVICCRRCEELCSRWLVAALLDVVLDTICRRITRTLCNHVYTTHTQITQEMYDTVRM